MKYPRLKLVSMFVPYAAVLIGLYLLNSAWAAILLYHFGVMMFLIADNQKQLKKLHPGFNATAAVISIIISVLIIFVLYFMWDVIRLPNCNLKVLLPELGLTGLSWYLFVIFFAAIHPLSEEMFWRVYHSSEQPRFILADLAFAGYHILVLLWFVKWPWLAAAFIILSLTAYLWRYLGKRYNGLVIPLVSHITADIAIITTVCLLMR
ncbi:MAG: hypothetical protein ACYTBP_00115 [Planctomycetota bacterium]|jgi:hypothetical protein